MNRVKIITNSVSELLPDFAVQFGIDIIPDFIIYGDKSYRQNIDITLEQFYNTIDSLEKLPTTSHPSIEEYKDHICKYEDYEAVIVLEVTSKMSSSYDTLCIAANELNESGFGARVIPYDSYQTTWGLGMMVIEAAKLASEGKSADEILAFLDDLKENKKIGTCFVFKSLANARKSGRTGAVKVIAAEMLGIKPIISMRDGVIKDIKIARGFNAGLDGIVAYYEERAKKGGDVYVAHSSNIEAAEMLKQKLEKIDPDATIETKWIGAVMGVFTGTGTVGIAFMER